MYALEDASMVMRELCLGDNLWGGINAMRFYLSV